MTQPPKTRALYTHRVLYGDTDQMGIVYYANYLRFFEGARNEWIRGLGIAYREIEARGLMLPVLEASVRYQRPARYDELLDIALAVAHTRVRIRFDYQVSTAGEPVCSGHTVHVCVAKDGRPTRAPQWLLDALAPQSRLCRTLDSPAEGAAGKKPAPDRW